MLSRRQDEEWSLKDAKDREYESDAERRFFETVENPPPATAELKEIVRVYGRFAK